MKSVKRKLTKRIYISTYALCFITILLILSALLEGCTDECTVKTNYTYLEPVFTTAEEIRQGISVDAPQPVNTIGKIYIKDHILFVNEPGEGIHIFDNTDPSHPIQKHFLIIPGTYDLAITGNILYADSYIDLVALDISNLENITEVSRVEGLFNNYNSLGFFYSEANGIVTDWVERKDVQVTQADCDVNYQPWGGFYFNDGIALLESANFDSRAAIAPGNGSGPGLGGSMARFTISQNHLYALDDSEIQVVDISSPSSPIAGSRQYVNWDIETIFPYEDKLFIGARSGMHILDISSPASPSLITTFQHARSCDPVVVEGDYAYVTLRSGNPGCDGFENQLDVINVADITSPQLLKSYIMTNPHGLGIDSDVLFVCDGDAGLKIYDATDKETISDHLLAHYDNIHAFDVIPYENNLIMIGQDGIYQYDYTSPLQITLLSHISITND